MAEQKVFAGPRLRRLRHSLGLTQTAMAQALHVSPSYLNLIERNQRPLTVQLLLKLSSTYEIDLSALKGDQGVSASALKEIFADPLLLGELPSNDELYELADATPNATNGFIKLYQAYRESQNRLSEMKEILTKEGHDPSLSSAKLPFDELRAELETRSAYFPHIDHAAEALSHQIGQGPDMISRLKTWLRKEFGISTQILPTDVMPYHLRRFDKHSMRLFISDRLSLHAQLYQIATEVARLHLSEAIGEDLKRLILSTNEAKRLANLALTRSAARALIMPYSHFLKTAKRYKFNIAQLAATYDVSFTLAAQRLCSLNQPKEKGPPFFMIEYDLAGHKLRASGLNGFPSAIFSGRCPKFNAEIIGLEQGLIHSQLISLPDESQFLFLSFQSDTPRAGLGSPRSKRITHLGVAYDDAQHMAYSIKEKPIKIGSDCRICERDNCLYRAAPAITKPLALDELTTGLSDQDLN